MAPKKPPNIASESTGLFSIPLLTIKGSKAGNPTATNTNSPPPTNPRRNVSKGEVMIGEIPILVKSLINSWDKPLSMIYCLNSITAIINVIILGDKANLSDFK